MQVNSNNNRIIRAVFSDRHIRVYQAYSNAIADSAINAGRFVSPPFSMSRMTWIKPSFLWMMYRSGWATKPGQERVLAIDISRTGFEWALANSTSSVFIPGRYNSPEEWKTELKHSPVRVQWDPDRDIHLGRMERRAIQVGLSGEAVHKYVNEWTMAIEDITPLVHTIRNMLNAHDLKTVNNLLPKEMPYYPSSKHLIARLAEFPHT